MAPRTVQDAPRSTTGDPDEAQPAEPAFYVLVTDGWAMPGGDPRDDENHA